MLGELQKTGDPTTLPTVALILDMEKPLKGVRFRAFVRRRPRCGGIQRLAGKELIRIMHPLLRAGQPIPLDRRGELLYRPRDPSFPDTKFTEIRAVHAFST